MLGWIAAPHLPPGFAAEPETPDASESEPATAEETVTADDTATTDGEPAVDFPACSCETCVGQSCSTCGGACSFFDPPSNACGVDPRIYRSLILGRLWFEVEYLAWASSRTHLPPLVTTSDPTASPEEAGVLGMDNTSILFGNADYHGDLRSGGRLTGGYWFTPEHRFGVEGSYFQVDVGKVEFVDVGDATPDLGPPIINAQTDCRLPCWFPIPACSWLAFPSSRMWICWGARPSCGVRLGRAATIDWMASPAIDTSVCSIACP